MTYCKPCKTHYLIEQGHLCNEFATPRREGEWHPPGGYCGKCYVEHGRTNCPDRPAAGCQHPENYTCGPECKPPPVEGLEVVAWSCESDACEYRWLSVDKCCEKAAPLVRKSDAERKLADAQQLAHDHHELWLDAKTKLADAEGRVNRYNAKLRQALEDKLHAEEQVNYATRKWEESDSRYRGLVEAISKDIERYGDSVLAKRIRHTLLDRKAKG